MECLYHEHLLESSSLLALEGETLKHAHVLRLREGEAVLLSNGRGLCAKTSVQKVGKNEILCVVQNFLPQHGELSFPFVLALGILDNRDRMEFAIEKAVELGVTEIFPLLTDNGERFAANRIKSERLAAKALAAMEQSQRACLPTIHAPCRVEEFIQQHPQESTIILADIHGSKTQQLPLTQPVCVAVGAEGGFSERELLLLKNDPRCTAWNLAPRRLRAETAALTCLAAVLCVQKQ
ncbi:MAG: 16S rRNA (uracil(1498)-N(3))-methyltransferase [Candidatus Kapaibacterium sp.]|nr:MAG: 16S rRNA (uracil(1498)-N(3))-methyltransferase [Candidatus Kapabacteria bacterium]